MQCFINALFALVFMAAGSRSKGTDHYGFVPSAHLRMCLFLAPSVERANVKQSKAHELYLPIPFTLAHAHTPHTPNERAGKIPLFQFMVTGTSYILAMLFSNEVGVPMSLSCSCGV